MIEKDTTVCILNPWKPLHNSGMLQNTAAVAIEKLVFSCWRACSAAKRGNGLGTKARTDSPRAVEMTRVPRVIFLETHFS
ncbi:hypothetical protein Neut_0533 [Nitrosomonas eutropha C91]|uniref:Uncharacterized protein n=1 Tax=Nitrosomonas eutropha (strain DSM 101675 / C91 / Nm57) TaxID=335283 RepID=Q0AIL8_NITEC|nr:hypothetical protein Neut_0533 [Nitrosomonas eutropha C91]